MALEPGSRLGPYEIVGTLGAGGMGEVYRAHDPRLGREVALKVLPEELARDRDRLQRFEREARAAGSLNHPNVLAIHDVGEEAGVPYLVTELLEGQTLRRRMREGGLTVGRALEIALQIAEGLAAAHAKGVVHRDLKPENLFVTSDGRLKILDFGLARVEPGPDGAGTDALSTDSQVMLGTTPYMSPEQVRRLPADPRSDIFSFGTILYELVARERPFRGETPPEVMTAILREDPTPLADSRPEVAPALERVVRRCLEKHPDERFQTAHDLALALEGLVASDAARRRRAPAARGEKASPYPGLSAFGEADADHFFGRRTEVAAVLGKLERRQLLALIGPSGAGKTSFLRAGLVPALPGGWRAVTCTPGARPFVALAQALLPELSGDADEMSSLLRLDEPDNAVSLLGRWRSRHREALLIVDAFEELFTLSDAEAQSRFAAVLGRLATEAGVHVLISMRDDFLFRCHSHPSLEPVFSELTPIGPPAGEELRRALLQPALQRGYRFEDDALVDEMLGAVSGERGALPLLAFAAAKLWEARDREQRLLTRAAYAEIGGVEGALARHAETTLERIGAGREGLVRELFRNLVTAQGTRAARDRDELLSVFRPGGPEPGTRTGASASGSTAIRTRRAEAAKVLDALVDARLLTSFEVPGEDDAAARTRIEVVHESLLAAWPRLVRWRTQDVEGAQLRDQLRQAAQLWQERGQPDDLLWTGRSYREYSLWRERYPGGLTDLEERFARTMTIRARGSRQRRRVAAAALLAAVTGVALAFGVLWRESEAARRTAEAAQILSLGRLHLDGHPTAALAYAIASLEVSDAEAARRFALEALWRGPPAFNFNDDTNPMVPAWSPDGRWLALGGTAGLTLFDRDSGEHHRLETGNSGPVGFSADSSRLVATTSPAALHVWSLPERVRLQAWTLSDVRVLSVVDGWVVSVTSDDEAQPSASLVVRERSIADGSQRVLGRWPANRWPTGAVALTRRTLTTVENGRLVQRPLDDPQAPPRVLGRHEGGAIDWRWPLPDRIATGDGSGEVRVWDVAGARLERTLRGATDARAVVLDPSGRYVAAAPAYWGPLPPLSLHVFDLEAPSGAAPLALLNDDIAFINAMSFHPGGRLLATTHYPDGTFFWNLASPRPIVLRGQDGPDVLVAFAPDGRLVSMALAGDVRVWPLWTEPRDEPVLLRPRGQGGQELYGLEISPDGEHAVVTESTGALHLLRLDGSGGVTRRLVGVDEETSVLTPARLAPDGRRAALSLTRWGRPELAALGVLDMETGERRTLRPDDAAEQCVGNSADLGPVQLPLWLPDGRLVSDGPLGLRLWDLDGGSSRLLRACRDFRSNPPLLVATPDSGAVLSLFEPDPAPGESSALVVHDIPSGETREVTAHGQRLSALALDPSGAILVTGDADGLVRVGRLAGGEPHLLYGHTRTVTGLAVSPDGAWIASAGDDDTIRLWRMPDLSEPPLHTPPHDALLEKLRSLTNFRASRDPDSPTGYGLVTAPFPGWKDLPSW